MWDFLTVATCGPAPIVCHGLRAAYCCVPQVSPLRSLWSCGQPRSSAADGQQASSVSVRVGQAVPAGAGRSDAGTTTQKRTDMSITRIAAANCAPLMADNPRIEPSNSRIPERQMLPLSHTSPRSGQSSRALDSRARHLRTSVPWRKP